MFFCSSIVYLIQLLFLSSCMQNKIYETSVSNKELEKIKKCLYKTIVDFNDKQSLLEYKIDTASLTPTAVEIQNNIWRVGAWVIEFRKQDIIAHYPISKNTHENQMLFVKMKKQKKAYILIDIYSTNLILD